MGDGNWLRGTWLGDGIAENSRAAHRRKKGELKLAHRTKMDIGNELLNFLTYGDFEIWVFFLRD